MPKVLIAHSSYQKLLSIIQKEISTGIVLAQKELDYQKVLTCWKIGGHIVGHMLKEKKRPEHGSGLFSKLARDLGLSGHAVYDMVRVYRAYPKQPRKNSLLWSHYVLLSRITDSQKRLQLQERIIREKMTYQQLRWLIYQNSREHSLVVNSREKLKMIRGELYLYRTRVIKDIRGYNSGVEIDCGFKISIPKPLNVTADLSRGKVVRSDKQDGRYDIHLVKHADREKLYTYAAIVERVVDADTLLVKIEVGFGIWLREKLRLRGVDAPEINTQMGRKARAYVEQVLKDVDFIIIKTYRSDKYDRYLSDIFYLNGEKEPRAVAAKGRFLNQDLIDQGLARLWDGRVIVPGVK